MTGGNDGMAEGMPEGMPLPGWLARASGELLGVLVAAGSRPGTPGWWRGSAAVVGCQGWQGAPTGVGCAEDGRVGDAAPTEDGG